jgi:hypothetical protein
VRTTSVWGVGMSEYSGTAGQRGGGAGSQNTSFGIRFGGATLRYSDGAETLLLPRYPAAPSTYGTNSDLGSTRTIHRPELMSGT